MDLGWSVLTCEEGPPRAVSGVREITAMPERGVAYLTVDPEIIDHEFLKRVDGIIAVE